MRRLVVVCLGAVLAVPATAGALRFAPGDGTLAVRNGDGAVQLKMGSGAVLGRIGSGTLEIVLDPSVDCTELLVWDADTEPRERPLAARDKIACVFKVGREGTMKFRLVNDENDIRIKGRGLWLSVVGRGRAYLEGSARLQRDGVYSLNGGVWKSMPDNGQWVPFGTPRSLP